VFKGDGAYARVGGRIDAFREMADFRTAPQPIKNRAGSREFLDQCIEGRIIARLAVIQPHRGQDAARDLLLLAGAALEVSVGEQDAQQVAAPGRTLAEVREATGPDAVPRDHIPAAGVDQGGTAFVFSQMVIGFGAAVLLLGAASEQQSITGKALRKLNRELESRVEERTAELRKSKEQMEKAAFHDPLTGLYNRRLLEQRFGACRAAAARKRTGLAVLLIDLDHFKQINDTIGHDAGDVILIETGRRLKAAVREYDVVARMGGDEFAVLLPDIAERAGVEPVCARIVKALTDRIFFNGRHIVTSPSIGVAFYPQHGDLWQDMYKAADVALYNAKRGGRCRWEWYQPEAAAAGAVTATATSAAAAGQPG